MVHLPKSFIKDLIIPFLFLGVVLAGCSPALVIESAATPSAQVGMVTTSTVSSTAYPAASATRTAVTQSLQPANAPGDWMTLPVIPVSLSARAVEIFQQGLEMGNDPAAFAKIGDCETTITWFLGDFDLGDRYYSLGDYEELAGVISAFSGSFGRISVAALRGMNAASVLSPFWANPDQCQSGETPLDCEFRIMQPSLVFIMLGTNDIYNNATFEEQMREIIETSIVRGVLPVLATKADNLEGDHWVNETITQLAQEYELPLWNFWAAVQDLPHAGLQEDGAHLTWAPNRFDDPFNLEAAWPWRNITALQMLAFLQASLPIP